MTAIEKLIERLWAINCGSQGCQSTRDEAVDALTRLVAPLPAEVEEAIRCCTEETRAITFAECARLLESLALENARLAASLTKISAIRDDIIGRQSINWSAHIYPIVAALGEAGFEGLGHDEAKAKALTADAEIARLAAELTDSREVLSEMDKQVAERDRLAAELAVLSEAAMDADLHCWGPGFVSPEHAAPYAKALRLLCQPNADRSNAAWKLLDDLRRLAAENAELREEVGALGRTMCDLNDALLPLEAERDRLAAENAELRMTLNAERDNRSDNGDPMLIDRLRAELETAKEALLELSQLGGGRSEGNWIAQRALAAADEGAAVR